MRPLLPLLLSVACGGPPAVDSGNPDGCRDPLVWYPPEPPGPDESASYFGCNPPAGWTTNPEGVQEPTDTTGTPRQR